MGSAYGYHHHASTVLLLFDRFFKPHPRQAGFDGLSDTTGCNGFRSKV